MPNPPKVWTVLSMLEWATAYFEEKGVSQTRLSIEWLLAHILDVKRLDLYLMFDRPLSSAQLEELRPLVKRRASHEPLQYIIGETDFLNTTIKVRPGVLIPRPETEQLVEMVLNRFPENTTISLLDIGTGSGCIPIALKKNRPDWEVYGMDLSTEALSIAKENAELNGTDIHFFEGDLFNPGSISNSQFNVIISNPPYILENERTKLDKEVVNFEPSLALFCSSTQKMYSALRDLAAQKLSKKSLLFLELHEQYGEEVLALFPNSDWSSKLEHDYSNKTRFLIAEKI